MKYRGIAINPHDGFDLVAVWEKMAGNDTCCNWRVPRVRSRCTGKTRKCGWCFRRGSIPIILEKLT
jgi:hypothetical protein